MLISRLLLHHIDLLWLLLIDLLKAFELWLHLTCTFSFGLELSLCGEHVLLILVHLISEGVDHLLMLFPDRFNILLMANFQILCQLNMILVDHMSFLLVLMVYVLDDVLVLNLQQFQALINFIHSLYVITAFLSQYHLLFDESLGHLAVDLSFRVVRVAQLSCSKPLEV